MTLVAYKSDAVRGAIWHEIFAAEAPELRLVDWAPDGEAAQAPYLVAWTPPESLGSAMPHLSAFFCIGAGVDHIPFDTIPPAVRLVRMVDPDLTASMAEYIVMATLALHRDLPAYLTDQAAGRWQSRPVRRAADRRVGIMGLGVMGQAAAASLRAMGFPVSGWSASPKTLPGIETFTGPGEFADFLARTDILVCLLPLTEATAGILCADLFKQLPRGAMIVNAGRGGHLVEPDLLAALDDGRIEAAVLDVLSQEPPPGDHPLRAHARVIVTPHIASATHPAGAARRVIAAIRRDLAGQAMDNVVDRGRAY